MNARNSTIDGDGWKQQKATNTPWRRLDLGLLAWHLEVSGLEEQEDERVLRTPSSGEGAHCLKISETLRRKPLSDGARVVNARLLAEWAHEGQVGADGSPILLIPPQWLRLRREREAFDAERHFRRSCGSHTGALVKVLTRI